MAVAARANQGGDGAVSAYAQIAGVAVACGLACSVVGVFLVLRRMAMLADAISHSILPGLVAGFWLSQGKSFFAAAVGATISGLITVGLVSVLSRSKRVTNDSAIGIVFPTMFALGVLVVSKYFANVHLDTDAVLYGEIAFAPFEQLRLFGQDFGPASFWILLSLAGLNLGFILLLYKELKLSTFDAGLAASLGFLPGLIHYALMTLVAVTTVGAFSAVGAILALAMIIVPALAARMLTDRLPQLFGIAAGFGAGCALAGFALAVWFNVSISGMIATTLGVAFGGVVLAAPGRGIVAQKLRRGRQAEQFAVDLLLMHLDTHAQDADWSEESSLLHIERELEWPAAHVAERVERAERAGYVQLRDGILSITPEGISRIEAVGIPRA